MKVFISGPMTGLPAYNFPAFDSMAKRLRALGFDVVSPAEIDRRFGFDGAEACTPTYHREIILHDLEALEECDAVVLLEGWERSKGAAVEIAAAAYWNIPVYSTIDALLVAA